MATIRIELTVGDSWRPNGDIIIRLNLDNATATVNEENTPDTTTTLFTFMEEIIGDGRANGKNRTADTYLATLRSFRRFRQGADLQLPELDKSVAQAYEAWLKADGVCMNTVSFYMRRLRAAYNRAVDRGLTSDCRPFKNVYTGMCRTEKRAVDLKTIKRLKDCQPTSSSEATARDLFLFSFYTRGMSFVDMTYLKKSDVRDGYLYYKRHKTGQQLVVKWEQEMQAIVDRLKPSCFGDYLLPIVTNDRSSANSQYKGKQWRTNCKLKQIGEKLHLERKLTMYVARHSWASIARSLGHPVSLISTAMGHTSEKTTQIYLKELDTNAVDRANRDIIAKL